MDILGIGITGKNVICISKYCCIIGIKSFFSCFSYEKDAGEKTSGR